MKDFIREQQLVISAEGVCFDARIQIFTNDLFAQVESEIHIRSMSNHAGHALYILNPDLGIANFPTLFEAGLVDMSYQPKKGLIIRGEAPFYGSYKMLIQTNDINCSDKTLAEIKARYYN